MHLPHYLVIVLAQALVHRTPHVQVEALQTRPQHHLVIVSLLQVELMLKNDKKAIEICYYT